MKHEHRKRAHAALKVCAIAMILLMIGALELHHLNPDASMIHLLAALGFAAFCLFSAIAHIDEKRRF